jgi:hypothetical protein
MVYEIHELPSDLPDFIEDPTDLFPEIGHCDLIDALGIHPDLLADIPALAESINTRALIVSVEEPGWAPSGLQKQIHEQLESIGVECEFPKPFCSLTLTNKPKIDMFVKFGFSKPEICLSEDG